ncbi:type I restriction-modification system subunit M N-terminal domain-containing protein [Rubrivirga marina]|uniref:N6 adenine-specific DNA methyltransferase N-terminal domain-containing protein n=1 Tax=Rubrivirga marina TaxID=1196024 RepID=A0A271J0G6_9BACT|nr:type I restriction-modification system subunit M N-terminal domain-containing protein [Rubrivirga marina]PAP76953.1 hypothetical protein BSZ37_11180 [Rubrivirga marina]
MAPNFQDKASFIWQVADDLLRGTFKRSEYGDVTLPFVVLRRLDCVLEERKENILATYEGFKDQLTEDQLDGVLLKTSGVDLTERDRVRVEEIVRDARESEEVQAVMTGNNTRSGQRHVVDRVVDERVYEEVTHGVDLFKKLSDPRANRILKARLFDELIRQFSQAA